MDDDQILAKGGTQDDIDRIAHNNGACGAIYGGTCDYCGKTNPTPQPAAGSEELKPVEIDGFKVGDMVKIKNYTGMGDPDQTYRVLKVEGGIATIQTTDDDKRAILSFMNTMHYGIDRLERLNNGRS